MKKLSTKYRNKLSKNKGKDRCRTYFYIQPAFFACCYFSCQEILYNYIFAMCIFCTLQTPDHIFYFLKNIVYSFVPCLKPAPDFGHNNRPVTSGRSHDMYPLYWTTSK